MNALMLAYAALLFVVLTPGVLMRLPANGSKMTVALTHGVVFAVVWYFTSKMVWRASYEGFQGYGLSGPAARAARKATQERVRAERAAKEAAAAARAATPA